MQPRSWMTFGLCFIVMVIGVLRVAPADVTAQSRLNMVLIFPDNLGWGEVGVYGSVRGNLTPRIDKMAAEGICLNNCNVEYSCTVSRAALMTGRYAIRSGATQPGGITLWEVTIAEALKSVGYATGLFGKWHLGGDRAEGRREPTQQGFDEFYGIPRTSNEAGTTVAQGLKEPNTSFIWEGRTGQPTRSVKPFNMETRRTVDRESGASPVAPVMRLFNLLSDPKGEADIKDGNPWAKGVMDKLIAEFTATTARYPHVPPQAPDPYVPPQR